MAGVQGVPVGANSLDAGQRAEVQAQLDRLLSSTALAASPRRGQLLRYLVNHELTDAGEINEYAIGLDVFEKPPSFDPRIESIVRTEIGRLRQRLKQYYGGDGSRDRVQIEIPLRTYRPTFIFRDLEITPAPVEAPLDRNPPSTPAWPPALRRWLAALILMIMAGVLTAGGMVFWRRKDALNRPIQSLVVLPFQDLSPDKNDEYLADGLTDELTNEFANWKDLRVVARTSAYQYKGRGVDIRRIGQELNVDAVLEGSLSRQGGRVRITAQLNRTADGYHLWSHSYETRSADMLGVRQQIAGAIAAAVKSLGGKVRVPAQRPSTNSPEALDLYLQANYQYSRLEPESIEKSTHLFQAAIDKDPNYVEAYVGLARAEMELTNFYALPGAIDRTRIAISRALEINPDSGDAHGLLAEIAGYYDNDWPEAEREFQLAIEKGANPSIRAVYGWSLAMNGRTAEAQQQCTAAQSIEPLGVAPRFCQFYTDYYSRRFAEAGKVLLQTLEVRPNLLYARSRLGLVYVKENNRAEAARQFDSIAPKVPPGASSLALAYASACRGQTGRAREHLRTAIRLMPPPSYIEIAIGYVLLGDKDAAIEYLRKIPAGKLGSTLYDPMFDALRSDARYRALERAAGITS